MKKRAIAPVEHARRTRGNSEDLPASIVFMLAVVTGLAIATFLVHQILGQLFRTLQ